MTELSNRQKSNTGSVVSQTCIYIYVYSTLLRQLELQFYAICLYTGVYTHFKVEFLYTHFKVEFLCR